MAATVIGQDQEALFAAGEASSRLAAVMIGFRHQLIEGGFCPDIADEMAAEYLRFVFVAAARRANRDT